MTQYRFTFDLPPHLQYEFDALHAYLKLRVGGRITVSHVARYIFTGSLEEMVRRRAEYTAAQRAQPAPSPDSTGPENGVKPVSVDAPQPEDTTSLPVTDDVPEKLSPPSDEPYAGAWTAPTPGRTFRKLEFFASVDGEAVSPGQKAALDRVDTFYKDLGWEKWEVYIDDVPAKYRRNIVYWGRTPSLQGIIDENGVEHEVMPPDWDDGAGRRFQIERGKDGSPSNIVLTGTDEGFGHSLPYDWGLGATV